uniref:Myb/SANT-like domain-containing protein n=1 Tax=Salix viminalis TaxID=40686 RepID=A0A6N2L7S9_SALVM
MADSAKASWSPEQLHTFCDICIRAIDMGMRPTSHFDKPGWMYVAKSFAEQTGVVFQRDQFKNKWDSCKKNWRLWNKLIGETGVGWSNELKTIAASDEWWRARIQFQMWWDPPQKPSRPPPSSLQPRSLPLPPPAPLPLGYLF